MPGSEQPLRAMARPELRGCAHGERALFPSPSLLGAASLDEPESPRPRGVPGGNAALRSASLLEELHFYFPSSLVESPPRIPISTARQGEARELWKHLPLPSADTTSS